MRATITIDTAEMNTTEIVHLIKTLRQQLPAANIEAHDSDDGKPITVPVERPVEARW